MSYEAYLSIQGSKQGAFPGESPRPLHSKEMPIIRIDYELSAPRDVSTGKAKGKRHHKAMKVTKEWGAASPVIFNAVAHNELLNSVIMTFWDKDVQGADRNYYTIKLTDAHIVNLRVFTGEKGSADAASHATAKNPTEFDTVELEEISFSFRRIDVEHMVAKTMGSDDWDDTGIGV